MQDQKIHTDVIEEFLRRVSLIAEGYSGKIPWNEIGDLNTEDSVRLEELPAGRAHKMRDLLVVKLNGGLGTSMGLSKAKSLINIKNQKSFLEITLDQMTAARVRYGAIPLILMNSFNTREDTLAQPGVKEINLTCPGSIPVDFMQNMVPRIRVSDLMPVGDGSSESWCPPGHGDIYLSLKITGILDQLLASGYRTAFLSNGDNLGAVIDERIYSYLSGEKLDYCAEVTPKTISDLKGGVLYRRIMEKGETGHIELLETAQVENAHLKDFQDVKRFAYFNINNLWINLESLRDRLKKGNFNLSLIVNPKETGGEKVLQLETAMGSAVGQFERSRVIIVPRERFSPVKTCADLLVRRSDACILREKDLSLVIHPDRKEDPEVILDGNYKNINDFDALFPVVPSLLRAGKFEVQGPVMFDRPVEIRGNVKIVNTGKNAAQISKSAKTVFENETVEL